MADVPGIGFCANVQFLCNAAIGSSRFLSNRRGNRHGLFTPDIEFRDYVFHPY